MVDVTSSGVCWHSRECLYITQVYRSSLFLHFQFWLRAIQYKFMANPHHALPSPGTVLRQLFGSTREQTLLGCSPPALTSEAPLPTAPGSGPFHCCPDSAPTSHQVLLRLPLLLSPTIPAAHTTGRPFFPRG